MINRKFERKVSIKITAEFDSEQRQLRLEDGETIDGLLLRVRQ